jgi:hypothetical protein
MAVSSVGGNPALVFVAQALQELRSRMSAPPPGTAETSVQPSTSGPAPSVGRVVDLRL